MAIEVPRNEEISGGGRMEGEKESVLPSFEEEQIGGIHIKKRKRRRVVKRDVDPYMVRVGIKQRMR